MKNQKKKLNTIISEVLKSTTKKSCSCGCNTCNVPPTLTEGKIETSKLLSNQITNKQPLHEISLNSGSKEFFNLWKEARKLYSRDLLNVGSTDEKILKETKLGEFGQFRGKTVPLDYPINEVKYGIFFNWWDAYDPGVKFTKEFNTKEEAEDWIENNTTFMDNEDMDGNMHQIPRYYNKDDDSEYPEYDIRPIEESYICTLNESKQTIKRKLSKDHILNKLGK